MEQNWYSNQLISIYNCHLSKNLLLLLVKRPILYIFAKMSKTTILSMSYLWCKNILNCCHATAVKKNFVKTKIILLYQTLPVNNWPPNAYLALKLHTHISSLKSHI